MKKLLVLALGALLISGCSLIPDQAAIKKLLTEDLKVTAEPTDKGVVIYISGMPDELPNGLNGLSVFVTKDETNLGDPYKKGLTEDDSVVVENDLVNGEQNFVVVRGEVGGTVTTYGFSRGFYPRPGGFGDYLGYDPGNQVDSGGVYFDRSTGDPSSVSGGATNADFVFKRSGSDIYLEKRPGVTPGGVAVASKPADEWLDVQDAPMTSTSYSDSVKIETGKIYQFMTGDASPYYGKFVIDSVTNEAATLIASGDAIKVWLRYAFQTAQGVGHY